MYIAAIIPPNNAETHLLAVKHRLFMDSLALSSWALKPMIPFAFTEERPRPIKRNELPPLPGGGLVIDSPTIIDKQRILGSSLCSEYCKVLETLFKDYVGFKSGLHGLHLFDTRDDEKTKIERMNQLTDKALSELDRSVFVWKNCTLSVFKLDSKSFTVEKWWRRVILSTIYEISFPKIPKQ